MSLAELRRIWGAYLSWPAVSQIWALTTLSSTWMRRVANSTTQMVDDDGKEVEAEDTRLAGSSEGKGGAEGRRRCVEARGGVEGRRRCVEVRGGVEGRRRRVEVRGEAARRGSAPRRRRVEAEGRKVLDALSRASRDTCRWSQASCFGPAGFAGPSHFSPPPTCSRLQRPANTFSQGGPSGLEGPPTS